MTEADLDVIVRKTPKNATEDVMGYLEDMVDTCDLTDDNRKAIAVKIEYWYAVAQLQTRYHILLPIMGKKRALEMLNRNSVMKGIR